MFSTQSPFSLLSIPSDARIVIVSDLFLEDYVGGAELTTQALVDSCLLDRNSIFKLRSSQVNVELLKQGMDKFWIFGNFSQMDPQLIPTIVANLHYSIVEYDYKLCHFRSLEKHYLETGSLCDCHEQPIGKMISAFYFGAAALWWMSEKQRDVYLERFPFLSEKCMPVLSSVFDDATLDRLRTLRSARLPENLLGPWLVLGSSSWVKGCDAAKKYCEQNELEHEVVWNVPYVQLLEKLATSQGFVCLPAGADTCPRIAIEAKLLGCALITNENVQHRDEEWFATDDLDSIDEHLRASKKLFWDATIAQMNSVPSVSGYVTTYDCIRQQYPFKQCIESLLMFCSEVCVVDGGSTDGTWCELVRLRYPRFDEMFATTTERENVAHELRDGIETDAVRGFLRDLEDDHLEHFGESPRVKIKRVPRDWNHQRSAVFDGMQKALARMMCSGDFCWQSDVDEIVHEDDARKVWDVCRRFPHDIDVLSLPVIEGWGGWDKVRCDVNPWKWRLSRNKLNITHGIPAQARRIDVSGELYAAFGDGCDVIDAETFEPLPHASFYAQQAHEVRSRALQGDEQALRAYERWFNDVCDALPCVFHYSWIDIERKIRLYRDFWSRHWNVLSGKQHDDTAESNMFFDVPWSQVTDEMIVQRAKELREGCAGHVFHTKWNGQMTPALHIRRSQPKVMNDG